MTRREITGRKPGVTAGLIRGRKGDDNGEESDQDEADALARKRTTEVSPQETTTIEGLTVGGKPHPLQDAWVAEQVPQCGYCQSGQIMQAASLLSTNQDPTKAEIVAHMDGNLCRCMTYGRIQKAIVRAAADIRAKSGA